MKLKKFALVFFVPLGVAITGVSVLSSKSRVIRAEDVARIKTAAWLRYDAVQLYGTNLPSFPIGKAYGYSSVGLPYIDTNLTGNGTILQSDLESAAFRAGWMANTMPGISWILDSDVSRILSGMPIIDVVGSYVPTNNSRGQYWDFVGFGVEQIPGYGSRASTVSTFRGFPCVRGFPCDGVYGYGETTNASLAKVCRWCASRGSHYAVFPSVTDSLWPKESGNIAYCCTNLTVIDSTGTLHRFFVDRKSILWQIARALTNVNYTICALASIDYGDSDHTDVLWSQSYHSEWASSTNSIYDPPFLQPQYSYNSSTSQIRATINNTICAFYEIRSRMYIDYEYGAETDRGGEWSKDSSIDCVSSFTLKYPSVWAVTNGLVKSVTLLAIPYLAISASCDFPSARQGEESASGGYCTRAQVVKVWKPSSLVSLLPSPANSWFVFPDDSSIPVSFSYDQSCGISNENYYAVVNGCRARVLWSVSHPDRAEDLVVNLKSSDYGYPEKCIDVDQVGSEGHFEDDKDPAYQWCSFDCFYTRLDYGIYDDLFVLVEWVNPFDWIDSHVSTNSVSP